MRRYNKQFKSLLALGQSQRAMVYEVGCTLLTFSISVLPRLFSPYIIPPSLHQGSFLDFDWSDGDVVFANSTCFDDALMLSLSESVRAALLHSIFCSSAAELALP
jgi:hypothetical protein